MSNNTSWRGDQLETFYNPSWSDSLYNKLTNLQNSIMKLGLRKDRYAETIRQALQDGRLKTHQIENSLGSGRQALQERLASQGLGLSGAVSQLGRELEKEAAAAHRENATGIQRSVATAEQQIRELDMETLQKQDETTRLIKQEEQKKREVKR